MVIRLIVAKVKDSQFIVIWFGIYSDSNFQFDYMYLSVYFAKKTKNDVSDIKMHSRNACACKKTAYWIPPWHEFFKSLGLQIHLAQNENQQQFVNSIAPYTSNWLRINFQNNEIYSDDEFRGESWPLSQIYQKKNQFRSDHFWTLGWKPIFANK